VTVLVTGSAAIQWLSQPLTCHGLLPVADWCIICVQQEQNIRQLQPEDVNCSTHRAHKVGKLGVTPAAACNITMGI
jgi:hypothetical protein